MKKKISTTNLEIIKSVQTLISKKNNSKNEAMELLNKWHKKVPLKNNHPILSENCN